jgi:hypothetical protein
MDSRVNNSQLPSSEKHLWRTPSLTKIDLGDAEGHKFYNEHEGKDKAISFKYGFKS